MKWIKKLFKKKEQKHNYWPYAFNCTIDGVLKITDYKCTKCNKKIDAEKRPIDKSPCLGVK